MRDRHPEVTADVRVHVNLVGWWLRTAAFRILPVAPHFSEHVWTAHSKESKAVQHGVCRYNWRALATCSGISSLKQCLRHDSLESTIVLLVGIANTKTTHLCIRGAAENQPILTSRGQLRNLVYYEELRTLLGLFSE